VKQEIKGSYLVSVVELAEYLGGISTTHIQKLERDGIVRKIKRGAYDLRDSVRNYIRYLKKGEQETGNGSYQFHRTRLIKGQADITERKAAAIKGEFHHGQCIAEVMNDGIAAVRSRLLALPTTIAPRVADISEVNECVDLLTAFIHEALGDLTQYDGRTIIAHYLKEQIEPENENDNS
jgi:phage terminase Nu1 subunit (DNA packaging protein)